MVRWVVTLSLAAACSFEPKGVQAYDARAGRDAAAGDGVDAGPGEDGAAATADAEIDAVSGPSVDCGGTLCTAHCCVIVDQVEYACSTSPCAGPELTCDDRDDCGDGGRCCSGGVATSCSAGPCVSGQRPVCGDDGREACGDNGDWDACGLTSTYPFAVCFDD